ncbi:unnamed protein product [Didymodactylos carnosus]|uniref:Uncharacterized protein n=1 Tax=Didymodactylos carnosus TaxID=1234261 RepID=A0A814F138_9BILA|nr:unnamed protein product [Didymodactylos carnosus]CAF3747884.1 unnamed protein product [Didymodactylos carnosus]
MEPLLKKQRITNIKCQHILSSDDDSCQSNHCENDSSLLCSHCNLQLCFTHLSKHNQLVQHEFKILIDEANEINLIINELELVDNRQELYAQLDQWFERQKKLYEEKQIKINDAYIEMCEQFEQRKKQFSKQILDYVTVKREEIKSKEEYHTILMDELKKDIKKSKIKFDKQFEQLKVTSLTAKVTLTIRDLTQIDQITIKKPEIEMNYAQQFHVNDLERILNTPVPDKQFQTENLTTKFHLMGASEEYLLIATEKNDKLIMFNQEQKINEVEWNYVQDGYIKGIHIESK